MTDAALGRMSAFEAGALAWYWANASGWAARIGITAAEFQRLRLRGVAREIFLLAMQKIESAYDEIRARQNRG